MSFPHWLVILSATLACFGGYAYVRDTLKGQTRPNLVTWSLWALAPLIGTGAALSAHADLWVTARTFQAGLIPLAVVLAALWHPQKVWKITKFDTLCAACAAVALIVWFGAHSPVLAVALTAIADFFAALPTIVKAWQFPKTETGLLYIASFVSAALILPAIPAWNVQNTAFVFYLLSVNIFLIFSIYRKNIS